MPRIGKRALRVAFNVKRFARFLPLGIVLCLVLWLTGCASEPKHKVVITGNLLQDGPEAISYGPPRDRVLWQYRTAAAAMQAGDFEKAKRYLDDALATLGGVYGKDASARKARGYFTEEAKKTFIGEPYERSMAYIYRGILYWRDGEIDNARACFRSAEFEDSDAADKTYAGDWVLPDYLDGLASAKLAADGADAFKRAQASAKNLKLPAYDPAANVLFFFEFGTGPGKVAAGEYGEQLRFSVPPVNVASVHLKIDTTEVPVAPTDDLGFQGTTRGGRVMDHVLGNKAVFKSTTDTLGNVALIGGLGTAAFSHDRTAQQVGLGVALAGLVGKAISAATTPEADVRTWDNLPRFISFASMPLPPGEHTATVEFLDSGKRVLSNLTKAVSINVPSSGDKVVFISDKSPNSLTL
jgi:hypothetical protein